MITSSRNYTEKDYVFKERTRGRGMIEPFLFGRFSDVLFQSFRFVMSLLATSQFNSTSYAMSIHVMY